MRKAPEGSKSSRTQKMEKGTGAGKKESWTSAEPPRQSGISSRGKWLITGSLTLLLFLTVVLVLWGWLEWPLSPATAEQQSSSPYELTGTGKEVIDKLKALIDGEEPSFVYYYKPGCKLCQRMEPIIFSAAEERGLTVHRVNLANNRGAMQLRNSKGVPLVDFYKELPAVAYYSKGWLIAWTEGEKPKSVYDEFYDHLSLGEDHGSHEDHEEDQEHSHK
ncbi:thioredoxin family protein [Paenibacillus sp. GCM10012307]|uniref:Thioredoxin family protein n=1 Tax=Paenibacillus roseus TaxID=2798579 RepID=A0A934MPP6_9BACL|nr:thioredoxin family protein [Paenibacillus roseus]MBJ6360624.1 thioredoxin family protein [Paenibacillus roseus]